MPIQVLIIERLKENGHTAACAVKFVEFSSAVQITHFRTRECSIGPRAQYRRWADATVEVSTDGCVGGLAPDFIKYPSSNPWFTH
jgi:hypothetical protein